MFYCITGNIIKTSLQSIAVDCSGVGFKLNTTFNTLKKCGRVGDRVTLYTYLSVREDALELFGFYDENELECFKLLISVSGIGPKAAIAVLSELTPDALALAIASGDSKSITKAQGIGPKIAQRIVLELKGKLTAQVTDDDGEVINVEAVTSDTNKNEAVGALQFLGYSQSDAAKAVASFSSDMNVEDMIREALKVLSGNL